MIVLLVCDDACACITTDDDDIIQNALQKDTSTCMDFNKKAFVFVAILLQRRKELGRVEAEFSYRVTPVFFKVEIIVSFV